MHGRDVDYSLCSLRDPSCRMSAQDSQMHTCMHTVHTLEAMTDRILAVGTTTPWFSLHLKYRLPLNVPSVSPTELHERDARVLELIQTGLVKFDSDIELGVDHIAVDVAEVLDGACCLAP